MAQTSWLRASGSVLVLIVCASQALTVICTTKGQIGFTAIQNGWICKVLMVSL